MDVIFVGVIVVCFPVVEIRNVCKFESLVLMN